MIFGENVLQKTRLFMLVKTKSCVEVFHARKGHVDCRGIINAKRLAGRIAEKH